MIRPPRVEDVSQGPAPVTAPAMAAPGLTRDATPRLRPSTRATATAGEEFNPNRGEAQRRIAADLATNLTELTRSYEAARADVLTAPSAPLFEEMAAPLLPRLAAEAVAPAVLRSCAAPPNGPVPARRAS